MTLSTLTQSWIASANGHRDFPLQNLPMGIFSLNGSAPRSGVAIGEHIFDLEAGLAAGLFEGQAKVAVEATMGGVLNAFAKVVDAADGALVLDGLEDAADLVEVILVRPVGDRHEPHQFRGDLIGGAVEKVPRTAEGCSVAERLRCDDELFGVGGVATAVSLDLSPAGQQAIGVVRVVEMRIQVMPLAHH